jgi:hypothetical protein
MCCLNQLILLQIPQKTGFRLESFGNFSPGRHRPCTRKCTEIYFLHFLLSAALIYANPQLGHVFKTHNHELETSYVKDMETRKRRQYTDEYRDIRFAFAPLVANSLGVCVDQTCCVFSGL